MAVELLLLVTARVLAALYSNISDCDEVFNYWEPAHYLVYGKGLQTWEYSPTYSIRSWAFAGIISSLNLLISSVGTKNKIWIFYGIRILFGITSAVAESMLYQAVRNSKLRVVAQCLLLFLIFSTGMFISSTAFLPSAFSMYFTTMAFAVSFMKPSIRRTRWYVILVSISVLVGWPFSGAAALPFVVEDLIASSVGRWNRLSVMIATALGSIIVFLGPQLLVDYFFYKKWEIVPLNIVLYNVFSDSSKGPNIFGTEPWWFYILNGTLNFNIAFLLAVLSLPALVLARGIKWLTGQTVVLQSTIIWKLVPFYVWLGIFSAQAHKEERFLFVVYPTLCFNAAVAVFALIEIASSMLPPTSVKVQRALSRAIWISITFGFVVLSLSRTLAMVTHYGAPLKTYQHLHNQIQQRNSSRMEAELICFGKEWYRFPSHYFVPEQARIGFLKSSFTGLLPKYFAESPTAGNETTIEALLSRRQGTSVIPTGMNDLNLEEFDRYVNVNSCTFIVDFYPAKPANNPLERDYRTLEGWETTQCLPFLDASETKSVLQRAFWVPRTIVDLLGKAGLRSGTKVWGEYCVLKQSDGKVRK